MGRRRYSRLAVVVYAILLATAAPRTAFASAPWLANCSGVASSDQVCIYRDWHWEGNIAHVAGDVYNYQDTTWPSSTYWVEDSVSSTKNLWDDHRVRWYVGRNWTLGYQCNQPNEGFYYNGSYSDTYSSHDVNTAPCS